MIKLTGFREMKSILRKKIWANFIYRKDWEEGVKIYQDNIRRTKIEQLERHKFLTFLCIRASRKSHSNRKRNIPVQCSEFPLSNGSKFNFFLFIFGLFTA